eukprot:m.144671 g.144671  ORF g.144671 m.144671 type:complete len:981 (-) comp20472_c1_seq6:34-2976(-)
MDATGPGSVRLTHTSNSHRHPHGKLEPADIGDDLTSEVVFEEAPSRPKLGGALRAASPKPPGNIRRTKSPVVNGSVKWKRGTSTKKSVKRQAPAPPVLAVQRVMEEAVSEQGMLRRGSGDYDNAILLESGEYDLSEELEAEAPTTYASSAPSRMGSPAVGSFRRARLASTPEPVGSIRRSPKPGGKGRQSMRRSVHGKSIRRRPDKDACLGRGQICALLEELGMKDANEQDQLATVLLERACGSSDGLISPYDLAQTLLEEQSRQDEDGSEEEGIVAPNDTPKTKPKKNAFPKTPIPFTKQLSRTKLANLKAAFQAASEVLRGPRKSVAFSGMGEADASYEQQTEVVVSSEPTSATDGEAKLKQEITSLQAEVATLRTNNETLAAVLESKTQEHKSQLHLVQETAQAQIDNADQQINDLQEDLKTTRTLLRSALNAKESLENELMELRDAEARKRSDDEHLRVRESMSPRRDSDFLYLESEVKQLQVLNNNLTETISELEHDRDTQSEQLTEALSELRGTHETIRELHDVIDRLYTDLHEVDRLKKSNHELQEEMSELHRLHQGPAMPRMSAAYALNPIPATSVMGMLEMHRAVVERGTQVSVPTTMSGCQTSVLTRDNTTQHEAVAPVHAVAQTVGPDMRDCAVQECAQQAEAEVQSEPVRVREMACQPDEGPAPQHAAVQCELEDPVMVQKLAAQAHVLATLQAEHQQQELKLVAATEQVAGLQRQCAAAQEQLRETTRTQAADALQQQEAQQQQLLQLEQARHRVAQLEQAQQVAQAEVEHRQQQVAQLEQQARAVQQQQQELAAQQQQELARLEKEREQQQQALWAKQQEVEALTTQQRRQQQELADQSAELDQVRAQRQQAAQDLAQQQQEVEQLKHKQQEQQWALEQAQLQVDSLQQQHQQGQEQQQQQKAKKPGKKNAHTRAVQSRKGRSMALMREALQVQSVLAHPAFTRDPGAAIREHLVNSIGSQRREDT